MHLNEHIYEEAKLIVLLNDGSEYAFQLIYDRYRNRILPPAPMSITIPAGQWFSEIQIPVINTPIPSNKIIIISLATTTENVQLGLGADRNYKTFTYTLTK